MMLCSLRKKSALAGLLGLGFAATLSMSCSNPLATNPAPATSNSTDLSFNFSGAKAIAASTSSSPSSSMRSTSSIDDLVKIKEDGTLEAAISFGSSDGWSPTVSFISVGSDKSVYICFQEIYQTWDDTAQKNAYIQFVRVYPDNHFDVLWPLDSLNYSYSTDGSVSTWTWAGMDSDPLQKGEDGQLYFKVSSYSGSTRSDFVYSYNPTAGGKPVCRTPTNGNLSIESFKIDRQNHLFIKSASYGSANYLRCYSQGVTAPVNLYYSSDSLLWVRGYMPTESGNAIILNGNNINSMSGIIRATLPATGSPKYDLLYSSGTNMGTVSLVQYSNISDSNPTAIVDCDVSNSYHSTWDSSVLGTDGTLDSAKLLAKIAPLYYDTPTITPTNFAALQAVINLDATTTYQTRAYGATSTTTVSGYSLGTILSSSSSSINPANGAAGFLRAYFDGKLMTDKAADLGLSKFNVENIANLIWGADGSLYGIHNASCYDTSSTDNTYVVKLLDAAGNRDLAAVALKNGTCKPSKIKIVDGYLYYRYSVMSGTYETGYHKLARYNIASKTEEEVFTDSDLSGKNVELLSYDVTSDNATMYISALDYATNAVIFGKIDLATKKFTEIPADSSYGTVRTF